jgi:hypothetical protein
LARALVGRDEQEDPLGAGGQGETDAGALLDRVAEALAGGV